MAVLTNGHDNIGGDLTVLHALLSRHQEKYQAGCQFDKLNITYDNPLENFRTNWGGGI